MIPPLAWPTKADDLGQLTRLFRDLPMVGADSRAHRAIAKQLRARHIQCLDNWGAQVAIYQVLCVVSPVVKEYGEWPNTLFLPDDPCDILFWDPSMELKTVEAMNVLERDLSIPADIFDDLIQIKYGELISRITHHVAEQRR